ncbi:MAG: ADP-forming succinate--CoA ligase subunit beta [Elusimicrobia bacterium]|nr:ADP-forming succinate--CoA ligase subunit beta [Elusimicrobiota bacterium]
MKLEEFQAKNFLERFRIPAPENGGVVASVEELTAALKKCGEPPWVLKAQVQTGGRGKAGGILVAQNPSQAKEKILELLGKKFVTAQTGPDGILVKRVLIEKTVEIERELYLSVTIDRKRSKIALIASAQGGMEIEHLAATSPEKIAKFEIQALSGLEPYQARALLFQLGLFDQDPKIVQERVAFFKNCVQAFVSLDASLLEINPLAVTKEGKLIALDAKIVLDDNALYRHPEFKDLEFSVPLSPAEEEAKKAGISYISLSGNIGCMVNGAGLAMATMDILKQYGGDPANFLDVGGGANVEQVTAAFRILLTDKKVRALLVNIFGGIMRCDVIAEGIVAAVKETKLVIPLVVRLEGNRSEEGLKILSDSHLNIVSIKGLAEAAQKTIELSQKNKSAVPA